MFNKHTSPQYTFVHSTLADGAMVEEVNGLPFKLPVFMVYSARYHRKKVNNNIRLSQLANYCTINCVYIFTTKTVKCNK